MSVQLVFVFFKQKTAYEMRISDWSSDVCSSDLGRPRREVDVVGGQPRRIEQGLRVAFAAIAQQADDAAALVAGAHRGGQLQAGDQVGRAEERCVGEEGLSTCRSRWSPEH